MSDFIDLQDIAMRNRIAVDGRVNPTVEDWNSLLTHIDRLEQENAELREFTQKLLQELCDIQSQCIGELAMDYKLDAQSIGESIHNVTGMTNPELIKHLELLNK